MLTFLAVPHGLAQQHGGINHHKAAAGKDQTTSSYSGMETRRVKALSGEQIADLMAGRGMGLALAAELNSYPGPSHVLELRDALGLTDEQASRTKALLEQMKAETVPLGRRIIEKETELDRLFSERKIISAHLAEMTKTIAEVQGALRAAHLRYHLDMAELLTPEQIGRYSQLRGYSGQVD
ncbi:MAG: periplasmic heavy metal sensor [Mesorhizobium sp.]|nr:MAG: periplasmic heavy metal sensor [Mesorhizobium sp.]TIP71808.1 MAG: periplasmic heavy metal sensor [Mesorhizobium sp.]TIQ14705.1 MAG: periplasmic heavy metal sensor [Mesorhizobium sp.]TIR52382.1 MAG: periplasmic heavy metal sensor [Mesorhizobium sp.]TJV97236.1 MAG: periplasmic heavy metal sensor [Mesorhizobium sp.]